jgi:hypothetical protein
VDLITGIVAGIVAGIGLGAVLVAACMHRRNMHLEELIRQAADIAGDVILDLKEDVTEVNLEADEAVLLQVLCYPFSETAYALIDAEAGTDFTEILALGGDEAVVKITRPNLSTVE